MILIQNGELTHNTSGNFINKIIKLNQEDIFVRESAF